MASIEHGWGEGGKTLKDPMPKTISFFLPTGELVSLEEFNRENVVPLAEIMATAPGGVEYIDYADVLHKASERGGRPLTAPEIWDTLMEEAAAGHSPKGEYVAFLGKKTVGFVGIYPEPGTDVSFEDKPPTVHAVGIHYLMGEEARGQGLASRGSRALHTVLRTVHRDDPVVINGLTAVYTINPGNMASQQVARAVGAEKDPRWSAKATSGAEEKGYSVVLTSKAIAEKAEKDARWRQRVLVDVH